MTSQASGPDWPVVAPARISPGRLTPVHKEVGSLHGEPAFGLDASAEPPGLRILLAGWISELRRRWWLASAAALVVMLPVVAYALLSVPTYTSVGVVQVSSQGATINPLLELAGASAPSEVETEVEVIRRREFVLRVLKELRLHLADPHQPTLVSTDLDVVLHGASPVRDELRVARGAVELLEVAPSCHERVPFTVTGLAHERLSIRIGPPKAQREYEVGLGEPVADDVVVMQFRTMPVPEGATIELWALGDGILVDTLAKRLTVTSVGDARTATNLVEVEFTDPDRETAQAVVQTLMQHYLDQSLRWQSLSASNAAEFIAKRLAEVREQLANRENTLREFAEQEHAVQLETQAEVTIRGSAELEAQKREIELQERAIGAVLERLKRAGAGGANLTSNFFQDPILASAIGALTAAETEYQVLRATLTDDHPRVVDLGRQIARHQTEIRRLLVSARRNLTQQRKDLEARIAQSLDSLSAYPGKELQLARHVRDVEVDQKLYLVLLEKYQEAQILEASTTTDKRIVDAADLPHRKASPKRTKLVITGMVGGLAFVLVVVYLAHLLQRRLQTVDAIKEVVPYPVYGTVPVLGHKATKPRRKSSAASGLTLASVWDDTVGPGAESFRALAVNISLAPAVSGHGRIVQVTSSQPEEGKSTVAANVAIALASSGGRVLLIDLDLRKPVQHRSWGLRRSPGYGDIVGQGGGAKQAHSVLQHDAARGLDILTAGPKLPDPLSALMGTTLESMLAYWSERYDYIVIDSPPVFVAGTAVIGRHADLVVVVARPGITERAAARHTVESLSRIGVHKALVFNGIEPRHTESYYGRSYE